LNRVDRPAFLLSALRGLSCGLAAAGGAFLVCHRLEIGDLGVPATAGVALVAMLAGWSAGQAGFLGALRRNAWAQRVGLAVAACFWVWWATIPLGLSWPLDAALGALGFGLFCAFVVGETPARAVGAETFALGLLAGFCAFSAGVAGLWGVRWTGALPMLVAAALSLTALHTHEGAPSSAGDPAPLWSSSLFLCVARPCCAHTATAWVLLHMQPATSALPFVAA